MAEYVEVEIAPGCAVLVQAPESEENELVEAGRASELAEVAVQSMSATLHAVRQAAEHALDNFREMDVGPDEFSMEFGIQLAAGAGVVIASSQATANLRVSLAWKGLKDRRTAPREEESDGQEN